jgi:hypothetical protein
MKKFSMLAVLAAALVSMFAVVGSAQAANWHVSPAGGAFTAIGPGTTLKVQNKTTSCTGTSASGTVTGSGGGIANGPLSTVQWNGVATVTPGFTGCTNAGINYTVNCGVANLNALGNGYNGGVSTTQAGSAGRSTNGQLSGILCTIKLAAAPSNNCTTVTGTVPGVYTNAATLAAGTGAANQSSLTVNTTGQALTASSVGGCVASIGTGSATFSQTTYTVSGSPAATVAAPDLWTS